MSIPDLWHVHGGTRWTREARRRVVCDDHRGRGFEAGSTSTGGGGGGAPLIYASKGFSVNKNSLKTNGPFVGGLRPFFVLSFLLTTDRWQPQPVTHSFIFSGTVVRRCNLMWNNRPIIRAGSTYSSPLRPSQTLEAG